MTETTQRLSLTVGQVADRCGVTRRTLHHYDEIDLVVPSDRSPAGYRLYTADDLTRLQHVLVYRRLGFALEDIATMLSEPDDIETHLRRQRAAVMSRLDELGRLVEAIDAALEDTMNHTPVTPEQMKEIFGDDYRDEWQQEAQQRWGDTDQWRQSQERTTKFSAADWQRIKADTESLESDFAAALAAGEPADGPAALDLAERHRASIGQFYDCPHTFHLNLAAMYLADPRFTAHYESRRAGLARYVHDAIVANAARHGATQPGC